MKYLIVGAGGAGGALGAIMTRGGLDVTWIARGAHLAKMREQGLVVHREQGPDHIIAAPKAMELRGYHDTPDVVFLCVKSYALESIAGFLSRVAGPDTIIIPVLNGLDISARVRRLAPGRRVCDGSIAVFCKIKAPGELFLMKDDIKVMMGSLDDTDRKELENIADELSRCGISTVVSGCPQELLFKKFMNMASRSVISILYDDVLARMQTDKAMRRDYVLVLDELVSLAEAQGIRCASAARDVCLEEIPSFTPTQCTSLYRDWKAGRPTEMDTVLLAPLELAQTWGVEMPLFRRAADIVCRT